MKRCKQFCENYRLFSLFGSLAIILSFITFLGLKGSDDRALKVQFAYPIMFPDPTVYDDWQTIFVGNHIYRRLIQDEERPWIPSITDEISFRCDGETRPSFSFPCSRIKLEFTSKSFSDCMGRPYSHEDVENEFLRLIDSKPWIFPHAELCSSKRSNSICITFDKVPDPIKRTRALMFRFGWSKGSIADTSIGSGPYCLRDHVTSNDNIESGTLVPLSDKTRLKTITFHTSQNSENIFDVALYGSSDLVKRGHRTNVHTNTPLPFYAVTNPKYLGCSLPWNSANSRGILREHLSKYGVIFQGKPLFLQFLPDGKVSINHERVIKQCSQSHLSFHIPDYIPNCEDLRSKLLREWNSPYFKAQCVNVMNFLEFRKHSKWGGFLVGLSPILPGKTAILDQYFNPLSPDSWTGTYGHPEESFYLLGMGQSVVTVNKERICDVRPNSMGLGNVLMDDFIQCK